MRNLTRANPFAFERPVDAGDEVEISGRPHQGGCRRMQQVGEPSQKSEEPELVDDAFFLKRSNEVARSSEVVHPEVQPGHGVVPHCRLRTVGRRAELGEAPDPGL